MAVGFCQFASFDPHSSPRHHARRIKIEDTYHTSRCGVVRQKAAIIQYVNFFSYQRCHRITDDLSTFDSVTAAACVVKVFVVQRLTGVKTLRLQMVEVILVVNLAPPFTSQAIDAPKAKLITNPRPVFAIGCIARWSVATAASRFRISKNQFCLLDCLSASINLSRRSRMPSSGTSCSVS